MSSATSCLEISPGALDEQTFRLCCLLLLQQSEQLKDGWSWVEVQGSEEGYLKKTALRSVVIGSGPLLHQEGWCSETEPQTSCQPVPGQQGQEGEQSAPAPPLNDDDIVGDMDDGDDGDDGDCCVAPEGTGQVLQFEYHVLFSCSYSTPVLYFRAFTLEGRSLSLEEAWSSVHPNFRLRLQSSPLSTIGLQEHPLLGQPFFMLHPCRTEEFMRPVLQEARDHRRPVNYVLSWLSVVGPVVGLEVPLKYSTQLHPAASLSGTEPD